MSNNKKEIYLAVLIYPLWALFLSFRHFRMSQAKNLFWLFCGFLGIIHIFSPEIMMDEYDGYRIAQQFVTFNQSTISWDTFFASFYREDGMFVDIYLPLTSYLLSLVTDNPRWLFFVFALVFGFFYSRNIWFMLDKFPERTGFPLVLLTLCFILICPIWIIDGGRMGTAIQVFVYGALPCLYNADKSKLIWCFAALLVHFSMIIPLSVLLLYYFIPKSINPLLCFYVISLFISELDLTFVRNFLYDYAPPFLLRRVDIYTNETYAQNIMEAKSSLNFYVEGSKMIVRWVITFLFLGVCLWGKESVKARKELKELLCFSLFVYSISNVLSLIPSAGRFIVLSQMFSLASLILFYAFIKQSKYEQKNLEVVFRLMPLLLLFPIIYSIRVGCDYYGVSLFSNPVAVLFVDDNQPLIQYIKSIF